MLNAKTQRSTTFYLEAAEAGLLYANRISSRHSTHCVRIVCIMATDHPLAERSVVEPDDLKGVPFVAFDRDTFIGHTVKTTLASCGVAIRPALVANLAPTVCQFVAGGLGVSLVHPLMVSGMENQITVRRSTRHPVRLPTLPKRRQQKRSSSAFADQLRVTANDLSHLLLCSA